MTDTSTVVTPAATTEAPKELSKREKFRLEPLMVVATTNPKKNPSQSYDRFENYFKLPAKSTVGEALKAGVRMDDIRHDTAHKFIIVGAEAIELHEKAAEIAAAEELERARAIVAAADAEKEAANASETED